MPLMFDLNEIIFWKTCTTHQKVLERTKCKMKNEFWVEKKPVQSTLLVLFGIMARFTLIHAVKVHYKHSHPLVYSLG